MYKELLFISFTSFFLYMLPWAAIFRASGFDPRRGVFLINDRGGFDPRRGVCLMYSTRGRRVRYLTRRISMHPLSNGQDVGWEAPVGEFNSKQRHYLLNGREKGRGGEGDVPHSY